MPATISLRLRRNGFGVVMTFPLFRRFLIALCAIPLAGCDPTQAVDDFSVGPEGGTITFAGGTVVLTVPPGALSQNTTFTVAPATSFPASPTLVDGTVFDIGPDGLTFTPPIILKITYTGASLPAGVQETELAVHKVISDAWQVAGNSTVDMSANTLTASISGLSVFGILGVAAASVEVTPPAVTLAVGASAPLSATVRDATGSVLPGRAVTWNSLEPLIAQVSSAGVVSALQIGTARVVAALQTLADTALVTVQQQGTLYAACAAYEAPAIPAATRTFYVDAAAGNDAADGLTAQTAWQTLEKANQTAQPGDHFLLNGVFQDQWIKPANSGTPTQKIVYRVAPGGAVLLSGGRYDTTVDLTQLDHIVIDGFEVTNVQEPFRLFESRFNWLRRLFVHDAGGSNLRSNSDSNRVEDSGFNRIGNEAANTGDAVYLSNGSDGNVIVRNVFGAAGHGAVWLSHQSSGDLPSSDNIIAHNQVVNPWANAIGLNGTANRTLVECNVTSATANGSGPNYPRDGMEIEGTDNVVRYNVIYHAGDEGISLEGWTFNGKVQNSTGNHVYNNTFWQNGGGAISLVQKDASVVQNNIIENNIFWSNVGQLDGTTRYALVADQFNANPGNVWPEGTIGGNIVRNNIFDDHVSFMVITRTAASGGNATYTLQSAEATFAGWESNLRVNPQLVNPGSGNFRLSDASPAIDAGRVISGAPPYLGDAPDLGARELR